MYPTINTLYSSKRYSLSENIHVCKQNLTLFYNNQFDLYSPWIKHPYIGNINHHSFSGQMERWNTDIQEKNSFLIRWAHNLSSLRTGHCEGHRALVEKAEHRETWAQGPLKIDVPNENTLRRAHTLLAGHQLDHSQHGKGSGNTLGKVCWLWHEMTAVYPWGELGPAQESQHLAHSSILSRKSKRVCWETEELQASQWIIRLSQEGQKLQTTTGSWFLVQVTTVYEALGAQGTTKNERVLALKENTSRRKI